MLRQCESVKLFNQLTVSVYFKVKHKIKSTLKINFGNKNLKHIFMINVLTRVGSADKPKKLQFCTTAKMHQTNWK